MARPSKPWFYARLGSWYVTIDGKKTPLGVKGRERREEAYAAWHRLAGDPRPDPPRTSSVTVKHVVDAFLRDCEGRVGSDTLVTYKTILEPFAKRHGTTLAVSLTAQNLEDYSRRPEWSSTHRSNVIGSVVTAYRYAVREKLIPASPLVGIRKPSRSSRGASSVITEAEHRKICEHADPDFRDFLELLWHTGARPGEIAGLTAEDVDVTNSVIVLKLHKTVHLGKRRLLFLNATATEILKKRKTKKPEGLLFPNSRGQKIHPTVVGDRFRKLCRRAGVVGKTAYGYRHTFATDALSRGIPDAQVAALLGHSSTSMLHRHYSHLTEQTRILHSALQRVRENEKT